MTKKLSIVLAIFLLLQVFAPMTLVSAAEATVSDNVIITDSTDGIALENGKQYPYSVNIEAEGKYFLEMDFKTVYVKPINPQIGVTIDGADEHVFDATHIWSAEIEEDTGRFATDDAGNERIPAQKIVDEKQTVRFLVPEANGYTEGGFLLEAGEHTFNLNMIRESIIVYELRLVPVKKLPTYEEYKQSVPAKTAASSEAARYEAEIIYQKSHPEISVGYDRLSPAVTPNDPVKIIYNVLGGSGYANPGQWVSWKIDVPEDGFYNIDFKYRQDASQGQTVRRQMYVDGKVLFEDLDEVLFEATDGFETKTLSDKSGAATPIYFTKGEHVITLKVILGTTAEPLQSIQDVITTLTDIYTQIVIIVGETPDAYRDYNLGEHIPELLDTFKKSAEDLRKIIDSFKNAEGENNSNSAQIEQVINLLDELSERADKVPTRQDKLRAQINTLAALVSSLSTQPLEIDSFTVRPADLDFTKTKVKFMETVVFRAKAFFNSFFGDYNSVGTTTGSDPIDIWVTTNSQETTGFATGRDQAQIVTQLVRSGFYEGTNVNANIALMDGTVILRAFVSGKGPDIALFVPSQTLANLYFRNAIVDLAAEMPNFDELRKRCYDSAFVPLTYKDKVYGFPEVQSFNMLYYRKDIFEKNGLKVPDTWEEYHDVMIKLQKAGMEIGISGSLDTWELLLIQNGGSVYTEDLTSTNMATDESIVAFNYLTDYFVKYSAPISYSPIDRFRTGQIPMMIQPATFYNTLSIGAIEINNLWSIAPLPGTVQEDGTINRAASCKIGAACVLETSKGKDRENAFKFIEWWTREETQQDFAFECEIRFGVAARYHPANKEVLETIPWGIEELNALEIQKEQVTGVPLSPAVYYLERNFNNAFRKVVYDYENPRDVIYRYGRDTNNELARKLSELGLIEE